MKMAKVSAKMKLMNRDCVEISCALGDQELMKKIWPDGEDLANGTVTLTLEEAETCYFALCEKRERMAAGFYDDYAGQVKKPHSSTGRWATHLAAIMAKLMPLAAGSRENHVETSLHRAGCVACQMAYDKRLPDSPSAA
jgi:hypothetical protein